MARIDLKNCTLSIRDNGSNSVEIVVGDGTLTYSEKRNMEYMLNRGRLDAVREGDEAPMDVRFDLVWEQLKSSTTAVVTPEEALKQEGGAADWVSTSADLCEPYAVDIWVVHDPICSTEKLEKVVLPDFRWEEIAHDVKAATLNVTGRCNAKRATITRLTQTT